MIRATYRSPLLSVSHLAFHVSQFTAEGARRSGLPLAFGGKRASRSASGPPSPTAASSGDRSYLEREHTLQRAQLAALLGDRDEAVILLRQAIEQGANVGYGTWLHRDPDFESLHDYPPFQELPRRKG